MHPRYSGVLFGLIAILGLIGGIQRAAAQQFTVELDVGGKHFEGGPLAWSAGQVHLLARDGELVSFSPQGAANFRRTSDRFESLSVTDLRGQLRREFEDGFEVSARSCYLIVHPRGQEDRWATRFEQLHRSFVHYFTARGWRPATPRFPLVAVVFPRQEDFLRYAEREGADVPRGVVGFYSNATNRVLLYELPSPSGDPRADANLATVIHEATHQLAFNTGIHSRFALPPHWVAEGLSTLFEAPGVWNARQSAKADERIDRTRLGDFRRYVGSGWGKDDFRQFLVSDGAFRSRPREAYATSWALTHFLTETAPRDYLRYVRLTASRPQFTDYSSSDRLRDFRGVFGQDLGILEARFLRFTADLARQCGVPPR